MGESLQKAFRSLEVGLDGLEPKIITQKDPNLSRARALDMSTLRYATSFRLLKIRQAFYEGQTIEDIFSITKIDPWFLHQIKIIVAKQDTQSLKELKQNGFSDRQIARLNNTSELEIRQSRKNDNILPSYKLVDTCAAEFISKTPYCYSTYDEENEIEPLKGKKVIILGGGPNRIGQGIEFDYCCVQAVFGLQDQGFKTIMINCNPETISTDFDLVDRLYFEPVTFEDVLNIVEFEKPNGVLIQFGGQTPLKIANALFNAGVPVIGTSPHDIDLAEDREKFGKILNKLNIRCPQYGTGRTLHEVISVAKNIGYPVLARPSYVLGGRAMDIVYSKKQLINYISKNADVTEGHPILIDEFLEDAFEFDVDALCDGENVHIGAIMQHIEEAGIHSGDSSCVLPAYTLTDDLRHSIKKYTEDLALKLNIKGLINIQFAIQNKTVYTLEVNPRSSRTIPFVSKVTDIPLAKYAAQISTGVKLKDIDFNRNHKDLIAVKKPVFPFNKFPDQKVFLSPEMKSTGEVIGLDHHLGSAYSKAEIGSGSLIPKKGNVFISVNDIDKNDIIHIARDFYEMGFKIIATKGTSKLLNNNGIRSHNIYKVGEGRPHVVDLIKNNEINLIINTPLGEQSRYDEYEIGKAAIQFKIPVITTISGANAVIRAIRIGSEKLTYSSLQEIFHYI